jgi:hypothetical protein
MTSQGFRVLTAGTCHRVPRERTGRGVVFEMKMIRTTTAALIAAALAGSALLLTTASVARAEGETVTITEAGFSPDRLGVPTNVFGRATIGSITPVPSPITHVNVMGPAGVTLSLRGTGTCTVETLENLGAEACPANSKAGFGGGEGAYELGGNVIHESFTLNFFLLNNHPGHEEMAILLDGSTPVSIEIVFIATVIHEPKPYGLGFSLDVPLIKVLPEASDASAISSFITLGAKNVAYYRKVHGKRKLFHVKGIITPKTCPHGGWPVASQFTFQDGETVTAKRKIPCPKTNGKKKHKKKGKKKG